MDYQQITAEVRDDVALLTLNRPERRNAWTPRMSQELAHAIAAANDDPKVGAIVLTGAGGGFCAGADMQDTFQRQLDGGEARPAGDWVRLVREAKPMVAAVDGAAVGVGLTMILPFDVIVASPRARFGMFFVKVGVVPELASTHFLVQRMGFGRASEMCLSARLVPAEEAAAAGLVDRLATEESCLDTAFEVARSMGGHPPPQLRWIKELLTRNACETDLALVQRRELARLEESYRTPEHREAVRAFIEKRPPVFR